jgi:hypothetical protein
MNNYAFVEGKKIKSAKFHWNLGISLKNGTKPEKIKKTLGLASSKMVGSFLNSGIFKLKPS